MQDIIDKLRSDPTKMKPYPIVTHWRSYCPILPGCFIPSPHPLDAPIRPTEAPMSFRVAFYPSLNGRLSTMPQENPFSFQRAHRASESVAGVYPSQPIGRRVSMIEKCRSKSLTQHHQLGPVLMKALCITSTSGSGPLPSI